VRRGLQSRGTTRRARRHAPHQYRRDRIGTRVVALRDRSRGTWLPLDVCSIRSPRFRHAIAAVRRGSISRCRS
jgi:hypothetical protein